ncbi:MAG: hypothetical protein QXL78_01525 [Methanocellales archaeon]
MFEKSQVKSYEEIMQEIMQEYDSDPRHWSVSIGRSRDERYYDILIARGNELWQIKVDTLFKPSPIGIGAKIEIGQKKIETSSLPSYGFRSIPREFKELASSEDLASIIEKILKSEPVPTSKIGKYGFVQGPVAIKGSLLSPQPLSYISEQQKTLDRKLAQELSSLLFKRYSGLGYL